jgi:flagellar hook-associated protein 2
MAVGTTAVDGVVSGIKTTELINSILKASAVQKTLAEARITTYEDKVSKITELRDLLGDLEESLQAMETTSKFLSYSAAYDEDNGAFTVETDGNAVPGSFDVNVNQIAKSDMFLSQGFASKTATGVLSTGTLAVTIDGSTTNITLDGSSTLTTLVQDLNDIDGVTAYVMNTGDASNPYKLVVTGTKTGADHGITLDTSGLSGGTTPTFSQVTTAQDAEFTVNGEAITSSTNEATGVIQGVTFNLKDVSTSAETVTIAADSTAIETKIKSFVDSSNAVLDFIKSNQDFDSENNIKDAFVGESSVRQVAQGILSKATSQFTSLGQDYDSAVLVGIESDGKGRLTFDSTVFKAAFAAEADQVTNFFAGSDAFSQGLLEKIDVYNDSVSGTLVLRKDSLESRIEDLDEQVARYDKRLTVMEARLRNQFNAMESILGGLQGTQTYITALLAQSTSSK